MRRIINSKRSIKKRVEKELRKLFPGMAIFVRRRPGYITPSIRAWQFHTYENWRVWIGKQFWSKWTCEMQGHTMESCDEKTMFEMLREEQQRILSYPL